MRLGIRRRNWSRQSSGSKWRAQAQRDPGPTHARAGSANPTPLTRAHSPLRCAPNYATLLTRAQEDHEGSLIEAAISRKTAPAQTLKT